MATPMLDLRIPLRRRVAGESRPPPPCQTPKLVRRQNPPLLCPISQRSTNHARSLCPPSPFSSLHTKHLRYAVLGAGFAGLSVAWHLLELGPRDSFLSIDVIDEAGIGGGASGSAGGLLHPYSPKARTLWKAAECWKECLKLLDVAERAQNANSEGPDVEPFVWRRGIMRPATTMKNAEILHENAQRCLENCSIELLDEDMAKNLIPGICVPFNSALHMPLAMNIHPKRYLQALFLACKNHITDSSTKESRGREITLCKKSIENLRDLSSEYDAVIICLGAKTDMLPELLGKLPIRKCRGVVTHLQLPDNIGGELVANSPSILSEAWIAVQGPRNVVIGSTWDWNSRNYKPTVTADEASAALKELLPKASAVYPAIKKWEYVSANAGLRAMPPLTPHGSLPLLGRVDSAIGEKLECSYWVVGGLGSRGLLYHGLLGNLIAQAVVSHNEALIPSELTSWKKRSFTKRD